MKKKRRNIVWLCLLVLGALFVLADMIRATSTIGKAYTFVAEWISREYGYERVRDGDLTILIVEFVGDKEGKHTSALEKGLLAQGWHSVRIRSTMGIDKVVDHSRSRSSREEDAIGEFAKKYGGDLVVTGEVGIQIGKAEIRVFDLTGTLVNKSTVDLTGSWKKEVIPSIERAVFERLNEIGKSRASEHTGDMLRRTGPVEAKVVELLTVIEDESTKENVRILLRKLSRRIGAAKGDASRLKTVRLEIENRLSTERENMDKTEASALIGTVANLRLEEGLITDNGALLNSSFIWSRNARDVMGVEDDGIKYTDELVGNEMVEWLLEFESTVALACRDRKRIGELLTILGRAAGCRTDALDTRCAGWATRAIFALRYGSNAWRDDASLRAAAAYVVSGMAEIEYGGSGAGYKWMDPMVQSERLLRESVGVKLGSPIPAWERNDSQPQLVHLQGRCPNLLRLVVAD